jgi:hypothetical protein
LIQYFLFVVTNESIKVDDTVTLGIPSILAYDNFGKRVTNRYFYIKYAGGITSSNKENTFSDFRDTNMEYKKVTSDTNLNARVGGFFIYALIECELLKLAVHEKSGIIDGDYKQMEYLRLTDISRDVIIINKGQFIFHPSSKLPMVCPPKEYKMCPKTKKIRLGGYLLNDIKYTDRIYIDKVGNSKPTILKDNNIILDLINGLTRTPYKINTDILDYIYKFAIKKCVIIDSENDKIKEIINNPYKSTNRIIGYGNRSLISKINLERNILYIAELYSDMDEIYFPVSMDNRTRIYCITNYFDYQKNDLAKALISFANPGVILKTDSDVIKYFKAFGGKMFGDNLDKKSLNHRVSWVDENYDYTLNFENNDIINKAENKSCFISFCFEYKRFIEFMSNNDTKTIYSYLPIQLDASCKGNQHLTLLTREKNLFDALNLASCTHDHDPDDLYAYISDLNKKYTRLQRKNLIKTENKTE